MKRLLLAIAFTTSISVSARAADYGSKGTLATTTTNLPAGFGGATGGKLVVPNAAGTYPLVIASHGWSATSANQVGWAEHFASWGFVVVAPDFPSPFSPDPAKNRAIILSLASTLNGAETAAKGRIDVSKIALEGHSAGGLATALAASELKPRATILFDPVDRDDLGKKAQPTLCAPVLSIFANGSSCNNSAGWRAYVLDTMGPITTMRVKGSTHCDGENADRGLACASFCGGAASPARQASYARYATAFLLAKVKGDAAAAATLDEPALKADVALEDVVVKSAPSCTPEAVVDAGVADASVVDASVTDANVMDTASAAPEAAVEMDAAPPTLDASSPSTPVASEGGCGCRTSPHAGPPRTGIFAFLLLGGLLHRRRSRRMLAACASSSSS